jgi:hypothetical protein
MATATLTFTLPEEDPEFRAASNGGAWQALAWEIDQHLRSEIKYAPDSTPTEVVDALQRVRDFLHEHRTSLGLTFE